MKNREGAPEKGAFGPAKPAGTTWRLTRRDTGEVCLSTGQTAFEAAARRGWALSELNDIHPVTE